MLRRAGDAVKPDVIIAIISVITFLMAAAGIFGSWRASRNSGALNMYRENAKAWEERSRVQETEISDLKHQVETLTTQMHQKDEQNAELNGRVQVLQDTLTGKAAWEVLVTKIEDTQAQIGQLRTLTEANQKHLLALVSAGGTR